MDTDESNGAAMSAFLLYLLIAAAWLLLAKMPPHDSRERQRPRDCD